MPDCANVTCPPGQKCEGGQCVDVCAQITCPTNWYCDKGSCFPPCSCFQGDVACGDAGTRCDRPQEAGGGTNQCVDPSCVGVACPTDQHCSAGTCVGYCSGVTCPPEEVCLPPTGTDAGGPSGCVNLCAGAVCASGQACDWHDGVCKNVPSDGGGFVTPDAGDSDGGLANDATTGSHDATTGGGSDSGSGNGAAPGEKSGCGCEVVGNAGGGAAAALALLAGIVGVGARRNRRRRS